MACTWVQAFHIQGLGRTLKAAAEAGAGGCSLLSAPRAASTAVSSVLLPCSRTVLSDVAGVLLSQASVQDSRSQAEVAMNSTLHDSPVGLDKKCEGMLRCKSVAAVS